MEDIITADGRVIMQRQYTTDTTTPKAVAQQTVILSGITHSWVQSLLIASLHSVNSEAPEIVFQHFMRGVGESEIALSSDATARLLAALGVSSSPQRSETGSLEVLRDAYGDKCEAYEAESHARMAAVNDLGSALAEVDRLRTDNAVKQTEITEARKARDSHAVVIGELRAQIARMQSQESFRVALLESVVSAARAVAEAEDGEEDFFALSDAIGVLDAWQPDDASTAVSVPDDKDAELHLLHAIHDAAYAYASIGDDPLSKAMRAYDEWSMTPSTAVSVPVAPPNMPSLAYVHTRTVIYNQKLRAVADAARDYRDNKHHFTALAEALDALDTWEADATAAMLSDDAEDMSADALPIIPDPSQWETPGVCPECGGYDGTHDYNCSLSDVDLEWREVDKATDKR